MNSFELGLSLTNYDDQVDSYPNNKMIMNVNHSANFVYVFEVAH